MDQNQRFEYLFQKGLDMESQMEKIIEDAQPKPKPEMKIKYAKPIIITRDLLTGTPEYQAQKQLSDLELEQEIYNTIKQAIRAVDNKPPEKYTNAVTEEMINDYRKEVIKPIDINATPKIIQPRGRPPKHIKALTDEYIILINYDFIYIYFYRLNIQRKESN